MKFQAYILFYDTKTYKETMIRKRRNQKENPTSKTEVGKPKLTIRYLFILRKHIVSRVSSYFPIGGHSVTRTLIKT